MASHIPPESRSVYIINKNCLLSGVSKHPKLRKEALGVLFLLAKRLKGMFVCFHIVL